MLGRDLKLLGDAREKTPVLRPRGEPLQHLCEGPSVREFNAVQLNGHTGVTVTQRCVTCQGVFLGKVYIPEIVRALRKSLELSLVQLAAKLGASESSARNWERGRKRPTPSTLKKMRELAAPDLAARFTEAIKDYQWRPSDAPPGREPAASAKGPLDEDQWEQIKLLAKAKKDTPEHVLMRCVRFGLNTLDPEGELRRQALEEAADYSRRRKRA